MKRAPVNDEQLVRNVERNLRRCLVSHEMLPKADLIRFVVGPEQKLFIDIDEMLPGRGMWVTATVAAVQEALTKKAFEREAKSKLLVSKSLSTDVAEALKKKALGYVSLCRKAGHVVSGYEKVKKKIIEDLALAVLVAKDSEYEGKDDVRTLGENQEIIDVFSGSELQLALSSANAVHALLKNKELAVAALGATYKFQRFTGSK